MGYGDAAAAVEPTRAADAEGPTLDAAPSRASRAAVTFVACALVASAIGVPVSAPLGPLLAALVVGICSALGSRRLIDAALVAPIATAAGVLAARAATVLGDPVAAQGLLLACAVSAIVASGAGLLIRRERGVASLLTVTALMLLIGLAWLEGLATASLPIPRPWATGTNEPVTLTQALVRQPNLTPRTATDAGVFLTWVYRVSGGEPYYRAAYDTLAGYNSLNPPGNALDSPFSYRLPLLYAFLAMLPANGVSLVLAALVLQALVATATFAFARRLVAVPLALASTALVVRQLTSLASTPRVLFAEAWAAPLGLIAVALFVIACRRRTVSPWILAAAAVLALTAALVRELAACFLVVGLLAVLATPRTRSPRYLAPWLGGIFIAMAAYAAHARAVAGVVAATHSIVAKVPPASFFHPDGLGLLGGVADMRFTVLAPPALLWTLIVLGAVGSLLVAARHRAEGVMLAGIVVAGSLAMLVVRTPGFYGANMPVGYWYEVLTPTVLACAPLAMSFLPAASPETPGEADPTAPPASTA